MKPFSLLLAVTLLFWAPGYVGAEGPAMAPGPLPQQGAGPEVGRIGIIAAVKGIVEIMDQNQVGRIVGSGAPIFLGDIISTDDVGQLQILLRDETIFTN